jgi:hypothetical protein
MLKIEISAGIDINSVIDQAISRAKEIGGYVGFDFNGTTLVVTEDSKPADVLAAWKADGKKQSEEFKNSAKGQKLIREREESNRMDQKTIDAHLAYLPHMLKENDIAKAVVWCGGFAEVNDNRNLTYDKMAIIQAFVQAGYHLNINTGVNFNEEDKDNYARYIIGQCLDNLSADMPMMPIAKSFADKWVQKFVIPQLEAQSCKES